MLAHASGMIGLPLRLLAREIYDRIVKQRGARSVALITGEEKIVPPRASYFVCTVEAMPLTRQVEFLCVDEIQLCADPARGHVFTHRLLNARGTAETMFLGSATMAPLIRRLLPGVEFQSPASASPSLTYAGSKKLTRLPRRSAVVAFSTENVYAIAELIRRQRGGAAVVMGSLSPRTRNAQVALYQSGEVDFLVATDAIGMGLNMDVDHVAFAGLRKFDGKRTRWLHPQEVGQIAGRAGRYRTDGTFGVTGEAEEMDEDLVALCGGAPLPAGRGGGVAQRRPGVRLAEGPAPLAGRPAHPRRPEARRGEPGRDHPAPAGAGPRPGTPHRLRPRQAAQAVGGLPDARLPQDHLGRARPPLPHRLRPPDVPQRPPAGGLDRRPVRQPRPRGGRDGRAGPALGGGPHPGLRRRPLRTGCAIPATGRPSAASWRIACPTPCTRS